MSIELNVRVTELERKLAEQRIELNAQIVALQIRVEMLEQARKPGQKPKDSNG